MGADGPMAVGQTFSGHNGCRWQVAQHCPATIDAAGRWPDGYRACNEPAATVPNTTVVVSIFGTHIIVSARGPFRTIHCMRSVARWEPYIVVPLPGLFYIDKCPEYLYLFGGSPFNRENLQIGLI